MKKLLLYLISLTFGFCFAQLEPRSYVTVGGGGDYTLQPYSPQSKFSRTQTIYYPEQVKFNGEITGIRFFTAFSNTTTSPTPNTDFILKIGHTTVEEFESGDGFIPDSELTQISISTHYANAYEWILIFDESFTYNGVDNLVIDIEDINPGMSSSALDGWQGSENFGNPPTRSRVSLTEEFSDGSTQTSVLLQNSYAKTRFDGNLQVCTGVSVIDIDNVSNTTADFTLNENPLANHYRYVISEQGEEIPETYQVTTEEQFSVSGLEPATNYQIHVKSDCDAFGVTTGYNSYSFRTRPNTLTVPSIIDFENGINDNYTIPSYGAEVNAEAANNSSLGVMLNGPGYPGFLNWDDYGDPYEENSDFIRALSIDVDLTINAINPILSFDINQNFDSYLRVKIKSYADDSVYTGVEEDFTYHASNTENDFNTVTLDLTDYVGEIVTIKLEHISRSDARKTYLDNIKIDEAGCEKINGIEIDETTDSITLSWDATTSNNYEVAIASFNDYVDANYLSISTNSYTFSGLELATSYKLFVRNICASGDSPWKSIYASTNPDYLPVGYDQQFDDNAFTNGYFSVMNSKSSDIEYISYYLTEVMALFQKNSNTEWVGGTTTTEAQAWNDNKDFITGLKFIIDGSSLSSGSLDLDFKQYHYYNSTPANSWFRVLINGTQYGPSYSPASKNSDPVTNLNIDLTSFIGNDIEVELQQVGRSLDEFSLTAISGDATVLYNLAYNATLSTDEANQTIFKVFPNPAKNYIQITSNSDIERLTVMDINGRVLKSIKPSINDYSLDVADFSEGMYILELHSGAFVSTKRFVKN